MAEALGLASGVIAVVDMATKVGGASIKLKRLWDEVNEVPSVLLEKAELVQGWDELFEQAELQLATQTLPALVNNKMLLQKSAKKARCILAELQVMIDGFLEQSTMGRRYRRKVGSTKVVLRKSEVKALDEKLDEALTQFQMAQSLYTMATLMHNPILTIESQPSHSPESDSCQSTSDSPIANSDSSDESAADEVIFPKSEPHVDFSVSASRTMVGRARFTLGSRGGLQFSLRTPDWLSSSMYSVIASKSIAGWSLHLRAHEVIPTFEDIGLIAHFENDDALAIFRFLDENRMTPFVHDMDGRGLLHLACRYSSVNFMSLQLRRGSRLSLSGLDTKDSAGNGPYWLWHLLLNAFKAYTSLNRSSRFPGQKMLQLLRSYDVDETAFENPGAFVTSIYLPPNVQSNLMGDEYGCTPLKQRLKEVRDAWPVVDFGPFFSWLPELKHSPYNLLRTSRGPGMFSFIHTIAGHLPSAMKKLPHNRHLPITSHSWFEPFCRCIAADPEGVLDVENFYTAYPRGGQTPFSVMINWIARGLPYNMPHAERIQEPLQLWITALLSCGMELLNHGRNEQALYRQQVTRYRMHPFHIMRKAGLPILRYTIIGITYGSHPEHWKLWWAFEYEDFAGDFWRMVEQPSCNGPELNIPGSWVEEPMHPKTAEWKSFLEWKRAQQSRLIWSEYRKIRPPV